MYIRTYIRMYVCMYICIYKKQTAQDMKHIKLNIKYYAYMLKIITII